MPERSPHANREHRAFLLPWLCSAMVVTIVRLLHAADLGYDLTLQIQAAQHLLAGEGLTYYVGNSDNLADPLALATLVNFPSGFSFYAAAMLAVGTSPATLVKVMGAVGTLVGWWGWALLAYAYMGDGWRRGGFWKWAGYAVAIISPLFFTLPWQGTDIVLWAAVPWILRLVVRSSEPNNLNGIRWDALAGALVGVCVLFRYASLFLPPYVGLLMVWQCGRRVDVLVRRAVAFGVALLPALAIQVYIVRTSTGSLNPISTRPSAGAAAAQRELVAAHRHVLTAVDHLVTGNVSALFWIPGGILEAFTRTGFRPVPWSAMILLLMLPVLVAVSFHGRKAWLASGDLRVAAPGLFLLIPLFLYASELATGTAFPVVQRYYWSSVPLVVCVAYAFAFTTRPGRPSVHDAVASLLGRAYVAGFVAMGFVSVFLLAAPESHGQWRRRELVGTMYLRPWPSFRLIYEFSPAHAFVQRMMRDNPDSVVITDREAWFYADPSVDRSRINRIESCAKLVASHVTGPAELLVFAEDHGDDQRFYWNNGVSNPQFAKCFSRLPRLRVVRRFPDEGLYVLQGTVPAGTRVALKDEAID